MTTRTQSIRDVVSQLDDIIQDYKKEHPDEERDWRTYEQRFARRAKVRGFLTFVRKFYNKTYHPF